MAEVTELKFKYLKDRAKRKAIFLFFFFIVCNLLGSLSMSIDVLAQTTTAPEQNLDPSPTGESSMFLVSGDTIKNFNLTKYNGMDINHGMFDHLTFESMDFWETSKEDTELIYYIPSEDGETVYFYYKIAMYTYVNIFTDNFISDCYEYIETVDDSWEVVDFDWIGLAGNNRDSWQSDITFSHYDFGNVYHHNAQNNAYRGSLEMTFDIDDNPLPDFVMDEFGNSFEQNFCYIAVGSSSIESSEYGKLSEDEPSFSFTSGTGNEDSESDEESDYDIGDMGGMGGHSSQIDLDINPTLSAGYLYQTVDLGVRPPSKGSSLHATNGDGSKIWDPKKNNTSQKDCKLEYNFRISPLVSLYYADFDFTKYNIDMLDAYYTTNPDWDISKQDKHYERPVAIHCQNRWIQSKLKVVFNVWTSYKIDIINPKYTQTVLEKPKEYYDNLTWGYTAQGMVAGEIDTSRQNPIASFLGDLFGGIFGEGWQNWLAIIILVIIGIIAFVIIMRIVSASQRRKRFTGGSKEQKRGGYYPPPAYSPQPIFNIYPTGTPPLQTPKEPIQEKEKPFKTPSEEEVRGSMVKKKGMY